jgi:hypothetical protein
MKKLLLLLSIVSSTFFGIAQGGTTNAPCATGFVRLANTGDCPPNPQCAGTPTANDLVGRIRVFFATPIPAGVAAPTIVAGSVPGFRFCLQGDVVAQQRTFADYCVYGQGAAAVLPVIAELTIQYGVANPIVCPVVQLQVPCPTGFAALNDATGCTPCNPAFPNLVGAIRVFFAEPIPAGTPNPNITAASQIIAGVNTPLQNLVFCAKAGANTTVARTFADYCVYSNLTNQVLPTGPLTLTFDNTNFACIVPMLFFPCATNFEILNQGGGGNENCPDPAAAAASGLCGGPDATQLTSTGRLRVFFAGCIPAGVPAPRITGVLQQNAQGGFTLIPNNQFCFLTSATSAAQINTARCFIDYCVYGASAANLPATGLQFLIDFSASAGGGGAFQGVAGAGEQNCANIVLPVNFKSITATRKNASNVTVTWETATETNNKGFNVQRNGGGGWETVSFVTSKANGGNSIGVLSYTFNDVNTSRGVTQYRVQQVDIDGKSSYSDIRAVKGEGLENRLLVYPNPSNSGSVNVVFEDQNAIRDVLVRDISGRLVKQYKEVTNNILVVDNLANGVYSIQVTDRTTSKSVFEKIVVRRN